MNTIISVIIPTLNRKERLAEAIDSIRKQSLDSESYEIIVVDNGSTDGTQSLVSDFNADGGKSVTYLHEPSPGLHWARHAGASAAKSEILAYTDDDAVVTENWLEGLLAAYQDSNVAAAGGPINVRWLSPPPTWVEPLGTFGHLDLGEESRELVWPETIYGGNFSIRKNVLFEVGGFNPDTAVEDKLVGDGECGLCKKVFEAGKKIIYVPESLIYHVQDGSSVNLKKMKHRYAQQGRFQVYTDYKENRQKTLASIRNSVDMLLLSVRRKMTALFFLERSSLDYYRFEVLSSEALARAGYYFRLACSKKFRNLIIRNNWISSK